MTEHQHRLLVMTSELWASVFTSRSLMKTSVKYSIIATFNYVREGIDRRHHPTFLDLGGLMDDVTLGDGYSRANRALLFGC